MKPGRINITKEQIIAFCQKNHIKKFSFFGSVLRDDFRSDSDIDVLIELDKNYRTGLMKMAGMIIELSEMLGRNTDLSTSFIASVLREGKILYERQ
jgi:predicted nucleotidyltransferase